MSNVECDELLASQKNEAKRIGFLKQLGQLAEAWDFDPLETLFLEVKALRLECTELRREVQCMKTKQGGSVKKQF